MSSSRHGSRVPKIYITLGEIYDLDNGEMNFQEKLRPQAKFLQALNPYCKRDGGRHRLANHGNEA